MRCLLVEDYAPLRDNVAECLREEGHVVDASATGDEGLWFARNHPYDEFDDYCAKVGRFTINPTGLGETMRSMRFNWRRLVSAEYNSAFIWVLAASLGILQNAWLAGELESPTTTAATGLLGLGLIGYLVARVLKKSGRLRQPLPSATA